MSVEDKQKNEEFMKKYQKEYRKKRSIKSEKDDFDYQPFVKGGHDSQDGLPLGFR